MTRLRSSEEYEMREALMAWGRARWPRARIVHELVVSERRIDMAFIEPDGLTGIEIKSSRDTLDRLKEQIRVFRANLPLVIVAAAPKWIDSRTYDVDWLCVEPGSERPVDDGWRIRKPDRAVTVPLLNLLWRDEAFAIAMRRGLPVAKREALCRLVPVLARALTGDEIVREVCRELRARDAFPKAGGHPASDAPIVEGGAS